MGTSPTKGTPPTKGSPPTKGTPYTKYPTRPTVEPFELPQAYLQCELKIA